MDDVFTYVMSSPWFSTNLFLMDQLSSKDRNRDKKRVSFNKFEEYLKNRPLVHCDYPECKELFVLNWFPELRLRLEYESAKDLEKKLLAQKFNGGLVMKLRPELNGRKLGEFLKDFMSCYGATKVLSLTESELRLLVLRHKS